MTEEKKEQRVEQRDRLNLFWTIVGPIIITTAIGIGVWIINAKFTMEHDDIIKSCVSVDRFNRAHDETTTALNKISDDVQSVTKDVATIKGELSVKNK